MLRHFCVIILKVVMSIQEKNIKIERTYIQELKGWDPLWIGDGYCHRCRLQLIDVHFVVNHHCIAVPTRRPSDNMWI